MQPWEVERTCCGPAGKIDFKKLKIFMESRRKASIDKAEREQMKKFAAQNKPNFAEVASFLENAGFKSEKKDIS
jgi:hypothetical protein